MHDSPGIGSKEESLF